MSFSLHLDALVADIPGLTQPDALNLTLESGQIWAILGPNGAGKTTLLHTLAGLRPARSGQLQLNGKPLTRWQRKPLAQQLGILFQQQSDAFATSVLAEVLSGRFPWLGTWQRESQADFEIALEALQQMDLSALASRQVNQLSGGERQRLALATLMAQAPQGWLLDEPTNHLDLPHQIQLFDLLQTRAAKGDCIVMTLHDINLAARYATHVLLLYPDGQACWGEKHQQLVLPALSQLFGYPLEKIEHQDQWLFVPAVHTKQHNPS